MYKIVFYETSDGGIFLMIFSRELQLIRMHESSTSRSFSIFSSSKTTEHVSERKSQSIWMKISGNFVRATTVFSSSIIKTTLLCFYTNFERRHRRLLLVKLLKQSMNVMTGFPERGNNYGNMDRL